MQISLYLIWLSKYSGVAVIVQKSREEARRMMKLTYLTAVFKSKMRSARKREGKWLR